LSAKTHSALGVFLVAKKENIFISISEQFSRQIATGSGSILEVSKSVSFFPPNHNIEFFKK